MIRFKIYLVHSLIGGIVMLLAMLLGEYLYGPIFNDFLNKPQLWAFAFLETIFWVLPMTWIVSTIMRWFPKVRGAGMVALSLSCWVVLSACVFAFYQVISDFRLPLLSEAGFRPSYVFGWYLPGVITIALFAIITPIFITRPPKTLTLK